VCVYDKLAPIKEEELRSSCTNNSSTISSTKATAVSLDDMLSNDFALALTVDNTNNNNMWNSSAPDIISNSFYSTCSPRMKKAITTKCLLDLGKKQDQEQESNSNAFSSFSLDESVGNNNNRNNNNNNNNNSNNNGCSEEEESVTSSSDCVSSCSSSRRSSESSLVVVDDGYFIR
jgi:hypothetical protein